jgi:hypothetical protein
MAISKSGVSPTGIVNSVNKSDNTGRDWGEAIGTGAAVLGSILSWGLATPGAASMVAGETAGNVAQNVVENNQDSAAQQKQEQASINAQMNKSDQPKSGTPGGDPTAPSAGTPKASNPSDIVNGKDTTYVPGSTGINNPSPEGNRTEGVLVDPTMGGMNGPWKPVSTYISPGNYSDKRLKTNIKSGNDGVISFLELMRNSGLLNGK